MSEREPVEIGVITGIGQSIVPADLESLDVPTPYGRTSDVIRISRVGERPIALLSRRGDGERIPPHLVPYRANLWALASLGVRVLVTSTVSTGLREAFGAGTFVVSDQFLDLTTGRAETFFDDGDAVQPPTADPFDPTLRGLAAEALLTRGVRVRDFGTVAVVNGPRFPTSAESRWYAAAGADLVNMTLMPETGLARELGMAVVNVSFITGLDGVRRTDPVDDAGLERMRLRTRQAQSALREALFDLVRRVPVGYRARAVVEPDRIAAILARPVPASAAS